MKIANCNIVGPDGVLVEKDKPIPEEWDEGLVQEWLDSGTVSALPDIEEDDDVSE